MTPPENAIPPSSHEVSEQQREQHERELARRSAAGPPPEDLPTSSAAGDPPEDLPVGNADPTRKPANELGRHDQERKRLHERIENDFRYHPPSGPEQTETYTRIRGLARGFAHELVELVPPSRELSSALTALEQTVFHANAGVARNT